jgi:hypothetical protein
MVWRDGARAPYLSERQWRTSREDRGGSDLERVVVQPGEYQRQSRRRRQGPLFYLDNQHGDFSYSDLIAVKAERRKSDPEYEFLDTGILKATGTSMPLSSTRRPYQGGSPPATPPVTRSR